MYQTFDFTATSTSEVLSFFANGGPQVPPFALLDGVTMNAVPEPGTLPLLAFGVLSLAVVRRVRRAKASVA
jgi:PEP-CTERM motif